MQHVYIVATVDGSVGALVGLDAQILISCTCVYSVHDCARVYVEYGSDDASFYEVIPRICCVCCCCILQTSGNDMSRIRMMDLSSKSSRAWLHCTS